MNTKRLLSISIVLIIIINMIPLAYAHPFTDVGNGWYAGAVTYCFDNNLMSGTTGTTFSPDTPMSRAMMVTVLHRVAGRPVVATSSAFNDVASGVYYEQAVAWAYENSIVNGTSATTFSPDANVTREQMVAIFYRFAAANDLDVSARADLSAYKDASKVASYSTEPFAWAVANGIITGVQADLLEPAGSATRAQCATIIMRFVEWSKKGAEEGEPTEPTETEPTDPDAPHEHSYTCVETIPVTCETDGLNTYTCSCGDSYEEVVAAGHWYGTGPEWVVWETPSIVSEGKERRVCGRCDLVEERAIPMLPPDTDVSFSYDAAMEAGNAYAQEAYGWIIEETFNDSNSAYYPAISFTVDYVSVRGQDYLNEQVFKCVDSLYGCLVNLDKNVEGRHIRCHVWEENNTIYINVYYG